MKLLSVKQNPPDNQTPVHQYVNTLLCSVVYWMRHHARSKNPLPQSLKPTLEGSMGSALAFLNSHDVPLAPYKAYTASLYHDPTESSEERLATHLDDLRRALPELKRDHSVEPDTLSVINALRTWHNNESPVALERIRASLTTLGAPDALLQQFRSERAPTGPLLKILKDVVKRLTGTSGIDVPLDRIPELRDAQPDLWKEYLAARKELNLATRAEIRDLVRSQGGPQDIQTVRSHLDDLGLPHRLPRGFKGLVGESGNLLTSAGEALKTYNGGDVTSIDPQAIVEMNPDYSPAKNVDGAKGNWVFKATLTTRRAGDDRPNVQYFYTGVQISTRRAGKFDVVDRLIARETRMVARWRRDLKSGKLEDQIRAVQCELIYETCARVGGVDAQNRSGRTYGLTTLTCGHVRKIGTSIVLDYVGKDSAAQKHTIRPVTPVLKECIRILQALREGKARKDLLWTHDGVYYNAIKLRAYFRAVSGVPDASPHKLRHLRGTRLARTELDMASSALLSKRKQPDQRAVDAAFKDAVTTVGRLLGHVKGIGSAQTTVWTTAAKNYVELNTMTDYYERFKAYGVRIPTWLLRIKA